MRTSIVVTAAMLGLLASLVLAQGVAAKGLVSGVLDTTTNLVTDTTGSLSSTPTPATATSSPPPSLTDTVTNTVKTVTDSVNNTVDDTVNNVAPSPVASPVTNLVDQTTNNVSDTVNTVANNSTTESVTTPVDQTVNTVTNTLAPVTQPLGDTVNQVTQPLTDTVTNVTQPIVDTFDQSVQQTVNTADNALTTAPGQVLDQVGQALPATQPVLGPLVDNTTDTAGAIVNHDVAPVTDPIVNEPTAPITDPLGSITDPTTPANPVNPTTPIVPAAPVGNPPITGVAGLGSTPVDAGQVPHGSAVQPMTPIITTPTRPMMTDHPAAQTPNGLAVDSQTGPPVSPVTATKPMTSTTQPDHASLISTGPIVPAAPFLRGDSDWTTTVDVTAGAVLHDLARAAHELRVSAPTLPLPASPIPTPSFPTSSLPISGSTLAGGASGGLSIGGSSGAAGFAAIVVMLMFALALTQRSLLARALEFPASITHPVPTSPA